MPPWCSAFRPDPDVTGLLARHPAGRRGVLTNDGPLEEDVLARLYPDVLGSFGYLFFCWRLAATSLTPPYTGRSPNCWRSRPARSALPTTAPTMSGPRWPAGGTQSATARPAT
jgi:hypothetical protein